jgi:copper transport protein
VRARAAIAWGRGARPARAVKRARAARLAFVAALLLALAAPAVADAHAVLERTSPSAGGTVDTAPAGVRLTYSEPIEPRFAAISVTDANGRLVTAGNPTRADKAHPETIVVPLRHTPEGWYLVYWRVISADGHPVRGAFTYAVGPNPGPAPQFVIPSVSETAATPRLLAARWVVMLSLLSAIGLFFLRIAIARPAIRAGQATLDRTTKAFAAAAVIGLIAIPVYLDFATAQFTLRSPLDLGQIVPLLNASPFGRGYLDLELTLSLFTASAAIAIAIDRPERNRRSIAEIAALTGAAAAAMASLMIPGVTGHAGQTSPRGLSVVLDAVHLAAGSIWIGGLIGLALIWRGQSASALRTIIPRFSVTALASVATLIATGTIAAIIHLPTLASLYTTGYGQAILVKIGVLLAAMLVAAQNLLKTTPRAKASKPTTPGLATAEVVLVTGAIFAAAVLTSLAPPAKAVGDLGKPQAHVGPGAVNQTLNEAGYAVNVNVAPNKAAVPNRFSLELTQHGKPVTDATITAGFAMLDMEMGSQAYRLNETAPGVYTRQAPALVMVGHWGLRFDVEPPGHAPFSVTIVDRAAG